jgi:hypothetical protein
MTIQRRARAKAIAATSDRLRVGIYLGLIATLIGGLALSLQHAAF